MKGLGASATPSTRSRIRRSALATPGPAPPQGNGSLPLSEQERQVIGHVVLGRSNKLAAHELGLSTSTVSTHLTHAMRKLHIRSRVEVVSLFASWREPRPDQSRLAWETPAERPR